MGPQIKGVGWGKIAFSIISNDPVYHNAAFSKGFFLKFFWEIQKFLP
jgi:hypothetical protein